ncbi:MAG: SUMF1/EgtB/PvdO family nonheme iron enzyme [Casimicrobiaceae bacterium]|nr:SUMF1/EgtB/PvdO family nonheme iron enzyme [Casimicrobiaceae bacterium]
MSRLSHESAARRWDEPGRAARSYGRAALRAALERTRRQFRDFIAALDRSQFWPPYSTGINPPLWEVAHAAWFGDWFCLRDQGRHARPSRWPGADDWLDSRRIAHRARWQLPELTRERLLDYLAVTLEDLLAGLASAEESDPGLEPFRWTLYHDLMHLEALAWLAQTLAWPAPPWVRSDPPPQAAAGRLATHARLSLPPMPGFVFDNELHAHCEVPEAVELSPLVRFDDFARWVEAGGYAQATGRPHPPYWRRGPRGRWQHRRFDSWLPCDSDEPVVHIEALAAEVFAREHGARLPTEEELTAAWVLQPDACPQDVGWVWEWTATTFAPYPGFSPGLYREYSAPWFDGQHRVLKGGSYATPLELHHARFRNFFRPERYDVFAGFRLAVPV